VITEGKDDERVGLHRFTKPPTEIGIEKIVVAEDRGSVPHAVATRCSTFSKMPGVGLSTNSLPSARSPRYLLRMSARRVVVTGGAGFIGSHLVDRLVGSGADVVVMDDLSGGSESNLPAGVPLARVDLATPEAIAAIIDAHPDSVVHCAAQTSVPSIGLGGGVSGTFNIGTGSGINALFGELASLTGYDQPPEYGPAWSATSATASSTWCSLGGC
jgi:hypothetical protein